MPPAPTTTAPSAARRIAALGPIPEAANLFTSRMASAPHIAVMLPTERSIPLKRLSVRTLTAPPNAKS